MILKIMNLLPGFRYSSVAANVAADDIGERLNIGVWPQIPRRPPGVSLRRNLAYRDGLRLDLLSPATAGRYPLVVYLPGGGFVVARKAMARNERAFIAAAGYAVASVEYRTTRHGATYAEGVADVQAAIGHLTDRADDYRIDSRIDPTRIAVWGESAGGYLASMAGLTDARVHAVVDMFGASDLSRIADGFDPPMNAAVTHPGHPIQRYGASNPFAANPINLVGPAAPAFLLMHGDDDRLIPPAQTLALHQALRRAGADSTHYLLAGAGHGRLSLSRGQARLWTSVQVMTIIKDFLDAQLRS